MTPPAEPTPLECDPAIDALWRQRGIADVAAVRANASERTLVALAGPAAADLASGTVLQLAAAANDVWVRPLERLPRDPNEQLLIAELFVAFGLGRSGQPVTDELTWEPVACDVDSARWRTTIPVGYRFYEGHFTGYPVLAGAVQLRQLLLPCLQLAVAEQPLPTLTGFEGIKFLARNQPGDTVDVVLRPTKNPRQIAFEIARGATRCTAGKALFAADLPPLVSSPASDRESP